MSINMNLPTPPEKLELPRPHEINKMTSPNMLAGMAVKLNELITFSEQLVAYLKEREEKCLTLDKPLLTYSMKSKNKAILKSFIAYCEANPEQRFWQALNNWSGLPNLVVMDIEGKTARDTYYWEGINE